MTWGVKAILTDKVAVMTKLREEASGPLRLLGNTLLTPADG